MLDSVCYSPVDFKMHLKDLQVWTQIFDHVAHSDIIYVCFWKKYIFHSRETVFYS